MRSKPEPEPAPAAEWADCAQVQTQRALAEAVKLVAEANESRGRQLRDLEHIAAWLQRGLVAEAARLKGVASEGPGAAVAAASAETAVLAQENQRLRQAAERWQAQLWPVSLRTEPWRVWRERLLERAAGDPPAAVLLARLHLAAAWERGGKPWPLELARDLGRAVYEAGGDEAEKLAQALTQSAGGRFELRVVRVGDRVDNKFMKAAVGGLVDVRAVASWAVRDQNGLWQFPAEVS